MNNFQKSLFKLVFGIEPDESKLVKDQDTMAELYDVSEMPISNLKATCSNMAMMYDFLKSYQRQISSYGVSIGVRDAADTVDTINNVNNNLLDANRIPGVKTKDITKEELLITPKSVYNELDRVPCPVEYAKEEIEKRIDMFKRKIKLGIDNTYTRDQMEGMVKCLERRYQYAENKEFFEEFDYTTQEKINNLLEKHQTLCMKETKLFIPTFPEQAIDVMERYTEKCTELFNEKPVFYVIAKKSDFEKAEEKHDPILLVQSPFGFYWQILGAWDEEMLLLEEL